MAIMSCIRTPAHPAGRGGLLRHFRSFYWGLSHCLVKKAEFSACGSTGSSGFLLPCCMYLYSLGASLQSRYVGALLIRKYPPPRRTFYLTPPPSTNPIFFSSGGIRASTGLRSWWSHGSRSRRNASGWKRNASTRLRGTSNGRAAGLSRYAADGERHGAPGAGSIPASAGHAAATIGLENKKKRIAVTARDC